MFRANCTEYALSYVGDYTSPFCLQNARLWVLASRCTVCNTSLSTRDPYIIMMRVLTFTLDTGMWATQQLQCWFHNSHTHCSHGRLGKEADYLSILPPLQAKTFTQTKASCDMGMILYTCIKRSNRAQPHYIEVVYMSLLFRAMHGYVDGTNPVSVRECINRSDLDQSECVGCHSLGSRRGGRQQTNESLVHLTLVVRVPLIGGGDEG